MFSGSWKIRFDLSTFGYLESDADRRDRLAMKLENGNESIHLAAKNRDDACFPSKVERDTHDFLSRGKKSSRRKPRGFQG